MAEGRDEKGRFKPGNKFWTATFPWGAASAPPMHTAETLHAACIGYFDWCHDNPLLADELVKFEGQATHEPVAKMRAMTNVGLCMHIGISRETWSHWRAGRADLKEVIVWADDVVYRQKFEGAAAGLLHPAIIARDLGLADRQEVTGADGGPIKTEVTSDAAFARLASLLGGPLPGASGGSDGADGLAGDGEG
jgi:hypothetical protein